LSQLNWLSLRGFKSFGFERDTTIELRPITLLYGENSAGKSSILHALLFLRQSSAVDGWLLCPVYEGEDVDLGDYPTVLHREPRADACEDAPPRDPSEDAPRRRSMKIGVGFGFTKSLELVLGPGGVRRWRLIGSAGTAPPEQLARREQDPLEPS
jgi:hypothetical protein